MNGRHFFSGLVEGASRDKRPARPKAGTNGRSTARGAAARGQVWREAVKPEDAARVRDLVAATGMFSAEEIAIAEELVQERVAKGRASGYEFVLLEENGSLLGYAC